MIEHVTPTKCVEFAIRTEEIGAEMYHQLAQRFASDRELTELFRDLGRDEVHHAEQFRALRDRLAQRPGGEAITADQASYIRAMSMFDIFSGPKSLATTVDDIRTRDDALERSLNLEKATLAYYQAIRDVLGADEVLDALIAIERRHVLMVMKLLITGAKFRGFADSY
jgi:rubrerythrin